MKRGSEPDFFSAPVRDASAAMASIRKAGRELRRGLKLLQAAFITFLLASCVALLLAYPRAGDKQRLHAMRDLAQLSHEVDVPALRRQMAKRATDELAFDLERVANAVAVPELTAKPGREPQTQLLNAEPPALDTLFAVANTLSSGARVVVHGPSVEDLAAGIRWRVDALRDKRPLVLTHLELAQSVTREAVEAEVSVEPARLEALRTTSAYDASYEQYTALRERSEALTKQGAGKPDRLAAARERVSAFEALQEDKTAMRRATRAYQRSMRRARKRPADVSEQDAFGRLVIATLESEGHKPLLYGIPVALAARFAAAPATKVPPSLERLRESPLWPEIKGASAAQAKADLQRQVSFHLRKTSLERVELRGIDGLQLLPLAVFFVLALLTRRCLVATRVYTPFGSNQGTALPIPGTGIRDVDRALLVVLPLAVCGLVIWSLLRLGVQPWFASALSVLLITQSVIASRRWKELHGLLHLARQRSLVQPFPERSAGDGASARTKA